MISVVNVASYISDRYLKENGERIDEMKLHKLLYFMQKECIVQTGHPMFPEVFHAWKYGPVMPCIRSLYKEDMLHDFPSEEAMGKYLPVFDEVFRRLSHSHSYTLVSIAHGELSWKRARKGYGKYEASDVPMKIEDIYEDADMYKKRQEMLKRQHSLLQLKGIKNHDKYLWTLARHRLPIL